MLYLENQPLCQYFNIEINEIFFTYNLSQLISNDKSEENIQEKNEERNLSEKNLADLVERIPADKIHLARRQTVLWDKEQFTDICPNFKPLGCWANFCVFSPEKIKGLLIYCSINMQRNCFF